MNTEEKQIKKVQTLRKDLDKMHKKAHKLRLKYERVCENEKDPLISKYCIEKKKLALIMISQHPEEYLRQEEKRLANEIKLSEASLK